MEWRWEELGETEGCLVFHAPASLGDSSFQPVQPSDFLLWREVLQLSRLVFNLLVGGKLPRNTVVGYILHNENRWIGLSPELSDAAYRFHPISQENQPTTVGPSPTWSRYLGHLVRNLLYHRNAQDGVPFEGLPARLIQADLDPDLCALVDQSQVLGKEPDLGAWIRFLENNPSALPVKPLQTEDRLLWEKNRSRYLGQQRWSQRRQVFLKKYRTPLLIAAGFVAVLLLISLPDLLAIRRTENVPVFSSETDVVYAYYRALDQNDAPALARLTDSALVRQDFDNAARLKVFEIVRETKLGTKGLLNLADWRNQGEPKLPTGLTVVGVEIVGVNLLAPRTYEVVYHKAPGETIAETGMPLVLRVRDTLRVENLEGGFPLVFLQRREEVLP